MSEYSVSVFIVADEHACAVYDIAWSNIAYNALEIFACRPYHFWRLAAGLPVISVEEMVFNLFVRLVI